MRRSASALVLAATLVLVAAVYVAHRSGPSLASLARPRARSPPLATDRIYFVMTDRYANGDPANDTGGLKGTTQITGYDPTSTAWWHGGDLKGLTGGCTDPKHGLERIKDLGFNAIWITPVVVNQVSQGDSGGYHGYWGTDFTRVDPHLGTDQDFADLTSCAHKLGMKVILDVVVNHTGDIIQDGSTYNSAPYRDCHGKVFNPARYVGKKTFPCMSVSKMPNVPYVLPGLAHEKKPGVAQRPRRTTTSAAASTSRRAARPVTSRATSSGSTTSSRRSRSSSTASCRSTPRGSRSTSSTDSASIPRAT